MISAGFTVLEDGSANWAWTTRVAGGETFVSDNRYWPASAHVREAEEPPRKPTGKIAGKLPVSVTLRSASVVHSDLKPANIIMRAPRMRRPHARGQGPK